MVCPGDVSDLLPPTQLQLQFILFWWLSKDIFSFYRKALNYIKSFKNYKNLWVGSGQEEKGHDSGETKPRMTLDL